MKIRNSWIIFVISVLFAIVSVSCKKEINGNDPGTPPAEEETTMEDLQIPAGFNFKTDVALTINLTAKDNLGNPIPGVRFDIYSDSEVNNGQLILSGISDETGVFNTAFNIPEDVSTIYARTNYVGIPNELPVEIFDGVASAEFGGIPETFKSGGDFIYKSTMANIFPMGTWNGQGVPGYLITPRDAISAQFLNDVNASFPEYKSVPVYHPEYLNSQNDQDFKLTETCDVWVTFVHEGAAYRNVLMYYTYNLNNPPANPSQIDSLHIVFPNLSFYNSSGGLYSGDKVYLGRFPAGKGIGFAVLADGFSGTGINPNKPIFYSEPGFNPEVNAAKKQHSVVLFDNGRKLFLMGFEDQNREGSCDNDFNDAMFLVKTNPVTAVQTGGFPPVSTVLPDADNDGVADIYDDYPIDPSKAFNNYYPSKDAFGTLAYEDLWPAKGDYDFNDVVVDYNFNQITNGNNQVVQIKSKLVVKAIGATYKNGFGFELGSAPSSVASVTGQRLNHNLISLNGNNTESGQSKAVIVVSDNVYDLLPYPGGGQIGVNTVPGAPWVQPDTIQLTINMSVPVNITTLGTPPYNPFIFVDQDRTREVHLAGFAPTSKHNTALFGTYQDDSDPASGRYYKSNKNLPWAINISQNFVYMKEKQQIVSGYTKFAAWAESSGSQFTNWSTDQVGFRVPARLYSR